MSEIRVLELIKTLDYGGAERLLVQRLHRSVNPEFSYRVGYLDQSRNAQVTELIAAGFEVTCFDGPRRNSIRWLSRLKEYAERNRIDVFHVHSPLMASMVRPMVATARWGIPKPVVLSTEHSVGYNKLTQLINRLTVRLEDHTVLVSDAVAAGPVGRASRASTVVHHGVDLVQARQIMEERGALRESFGFGAGPIVVTVANYRPEKDLLTLLGAAQIVHAYIHSVRFVIAGADGADADKLRAHVADHDQSSYVALLGRVDGGMKLAAAGDVFALSSVREGLPVAVMESLAVGTPVVATRVGGLPEIIDEANGALVPPRDPARLAEAIVELIERSQGSPSLRDAVIASSARLSIDSARDQIERVVHELITARRCHSS